MAKVRAPSLTRYVSGLLCVIVFDQLLQATQSTSRSLCPEHLTKTSEPTSYCGRNLSTPQILITATETGQKERDVVLRSRGIDTSILVPAPPTQCDLLATGLGRFVGGAASASLAKLNHGGQTANDLLTLFQNAKSKNKGGREHMTKDASIENRLFPEELTERYKEAKCFTSGVVFGVWRRISCPLRYGTR